MQLASGEPPAFTLYIYIYIYQYREVFLVGYGGFFMVFGGSPTGSGLLASSHLDTWAKSSLKLVISMGVL